MFFSAKSKGFFVDSGVNSVLLARTSSSVSPFLVEDLIECTAGDPVALAEAISTINPAKAPSGYMHAVCGITTPRRVVRRVTVEPKRLKEPTYLNELTVQQLRIEPEQYALAALSPSRGTDYDMVKSVEKDMVICGLPNSERGVLQDGLIEAGVYPEAMELGSVASVGAMIDYLNFAGIKTPVLMLEVESQSTNSYIVSAGGLEAARPIAQGLDSMIPLVQKELGLKDEAAARKLFLSNAFDFTGMGSVLIKKVIKELQSSIGFYEVQTGQSISQVACTVLPPKLAWLEVAIAADLGVTVFKPDIPAWLTARSITLADHLVPASQDIRRMGLLGLMVRNNAGHSSASEKTK
ncbi:MAG: hypothetical protein H2172_09295 [Opitutus sp.]|nr:hypothetical protein [Opitutus sp.]MCS6246992.1 hypothetical protein [Opitutus sp.]MCS6273216.1 hypothetical protein [Opitutus sp.]MCS6276550.1 hypothetical protein [Opitutus sp.]MCS6301802.1 hypothetical protein [Opitutus sp.]